MVRVALPSKCYIYSFRLPKQGNATPLTKQLGSRHYFREYAPVKYLQLGKTGNTIILGPILENYQSPLSVIAYRRMQ